ncbi:MAG TPA: DnaA/Hda family protein [Roseiarcus sp.]|nr:DnaA/Hda family protein [Roseiarcus sp.]
MIRPPRQLTLDWPHQPSFAREDFLAAPSNREALRAIDQWPNWAARMLLLVGPEGAGKSHLAWFWARTANATVAHGASLDLASLELGAQTSALLIEDADRIGPAEDRLFHLVNAALQNGVWTLLTARAAPEAWDLRTPDLLSRLRLAPVIRLEAPDIELTEAVLFKLFSDRQLEVEPHVVAYIALRIERSLGEARRLVDMLDREALALGRRVTRAMASQLLRELAPEDDAP